MQKQEVEKLFLLLSQLFPAAAAKKEKDSFVHAWHLLFEPYSYKAVRQAVLEHARECRFFPDASEIIQRLPDDPDLLRAQEQRKYTEMQVPEYAKQEIRQLHRRLRHAGLPNAVEAKRQGIPHKEYCRMLQEAGI